MSSRGDGGLRRVEFEVRCSFAGISYVIVLIFGIASVVQGGGLVGWKFKLILIGNRGGFNLRLGVSSFADLKSTLHITNEINRLFHCIRSRRRTLLRM